MRIRFALLAVVLMLAVSACGCAKRFVGNKVNMETANAEPVSLLPGDSHNAYFQLPHFIVTLNIARGENGEYSVVGQAHPQSNVNGKIERGEFRLILIKDAVVVDSEVIRFKSQRTTSVIPLSASFASQDFDHALVTYDLIVRH